MSGTIKYLLMTIFTEEQRNQFLDFLKKETVNLHSRYHGSKLLEAEFMHGNVVIHYGDESVQYFSLASQSQQEIELLLEKFNFEHDSLSELTPGNFRGVRTAMSR